MKRKGMWIAAATFFLALSFNVYAQEAAPSGKIGYLDIARVFDEYGKTKDYDAVLAKKQGDYEAERNKQIEKIRDAQGKLSVLKEEERNKLQGQIDKDTVSLKEFDRQNQIDLKKERDEKLKDILSEIEKTVKEFAEKEGYTFILNDRVLVYGPQDLNISSQIIKLLNDKYPAKK